MPFGFGRKDRSEEDAGLFLAVGLGNPGPRYARTRHNMGRMVVEALAEGRGMAFKSARQGAETARGSINGRPLLLALPMTYMNESGGPVARLVHYYRVPTDRLLVVCDELDLPFGTIRLRPRGSSAGNRGLRSIIQALGTDDFARLRVGVGRPREDAIDHVLGRFPPEQEKVLPRLIEIAVQAVEAVLTGGVTDAMNRFNRDWLPLLTDEDGSSDTSSKRAETSSVSESGPRSSGSGDSP